ncbi:type II secretion system protein [Novipirellula sp.]|uniref:type II secretion system protein n=1 Tax=Novipirellula sp. TaxID=2795430 RepID=UPI003565B9E0
MMISKINQSSRDPRYGVTLIEVIGTLSVLLAIGISSATIMSSVTKIGRRGNASVQQRNAIQRFATQLRTDVHQANELPSSTEETWPLQLIGSDFEVRYQWNAEQGSLRRTRLESGQVKSVESFEIGKERNAALRIRESQVTVVIDTESASHPFMVEAVHRQPAFEAPAPETPAPETPNPDKAEQ